MDMIKEIAISLDSSNTSFWDPASKGARLSAFKIDPSITNGTALIANDYVISAASGKPFLNVSAICKESSAQQKFCLPGAVTALSVSPDNLYCVAAISKKLYVWQVPSGQLMSVVEHHLQDVKCIRFTTDSGYFVSGGEDCCVCVWDIQNVLRQRAGPVVQKVKPLYSWIDHSTAVTDIYVGNDGLNSRMFTVSKDKTCQVYHLQTGKRIFTIFADQSLTSVIIDDGEYVLSLGTGLGTIFQVNWSNKLHLTSFSVHKEAEGVSVLNGHMDSVTCMTYSSNGKLMLSGSADKTARLWDVLEKACLAVFNHSGVVTSVHFLLAPACFLNGKCRPRKSEITTFSRSQIEKLRDITVMQKLENIVTKAPPSDPCYDMFKEAVEEGFSTVSAQSKAELCKNFDKAQVINQQMYSFAVNTVRLHMPGYRIFES